MESLLILNYRCRKNMLNEHVGNGTNLFVWSDLFFKKDEELYNKVYKQSEKYINIKKYIEVL